MIASYLMYYHFPKFDACRLWGDTVTKTGQWEKGLGPTPPHSLQLTKLFKIHLMSLSIWDIVTS